jgi:hypothetical protein
MIDRDRGREGQREREREIERQRQRERGSVAVRRQENGRSSRPPWSAAGRSSPS